MSPPPSGAHVLQRMNGCEWDNATGEVVGFNQYGYDGEDFIALDLRTLTWTAPSPQAFITKRRWDSDAARLEFNRNYYIHKCPEQLKKYVECGKSFLQRTGTRSRDRHKYYYSFQKEADNRDEVKEL